MERGVTDWLGTHRANLTGAITVFDAPRVQRAIPVVYASSAAVYGDAATVPIAEATERPPALGLWRRQARLRTARPRRQPRACASPTVGLRFFNVYGPRQDPRSPYSGVISIFCERIRRGAPIDIFGDGGQTRDFVYVADVVAALVAAMRLAPADAPVFNVCTGTATSVLDLAHTIAELTGTLLDARHRPPRAGEIRHSTGSPALSRSAPGIGGPVAASAAAWARCWTGWRRS